MLLFTYLKGRTKQMDYFTKEGIEKLLEDEEVVRRLTEFMAMDGETFFNEVRSHLSPAAVIPRSAAMISTICWRITFASRRAFLIVAITAFSVNCSMLPLRPKSR